MIMETKQHKKLGAKLANHGQTFGTTESLPQKQHAETTVRRTNTMQMMMVIIVGILRGILRGIRAGRISAARGNPSVGLRIGHGTS